MRIKEIELDNFKSFGKHTLIPLLDGFTTISGPNGSGKSNIVDSLLFALGLSSTRSMRAERLPDLLNNLSGKNEAKVTVRFLGDDGEELEVCRRIRVKDNGYTSTYLLNGKNSTLSDIHEALTKYNVSPTGFNVIMQGDVTGIVTMSASERRKIIDELAGVAEFDRRIEQAQQELSQVGEKIEHQKIILAEILTRLDTLREDKDQALKYLDLKAQKEAVEKDLIFVKAQELKEKAANEVAALKRLEETQTSLLEELTQTEINLVTLRAQMTQIDSEIKDKGGNEQLLLRQELENARGELTREENKLSNLAGVIGEKSKILKSIASQIKAVDKHLGEIVRQKKQHKEDQKAVHVALTEKQGAFSAVMAEIEVMRQEKDRSSDQVSALHGDLQKLREQKHEHEIKKAELSTHKQSLTKELEALRNLATELIGKLATTKNSIGGFERKHQDQEATVAGIERNIKLLADELQSTQDEIESKRAALEALNRHLIEAETTREVVGESGYGKAVEVVLNSNISGIHGTIGQLAEVDDQYVTALETAVGNRLSNIVVDDDQVAQNCIEFLKQCKAGRATFVPLNKIAAQPPGLLPNRPGVIDFAYNIIRFDPKYTRAFQYACGQTIIMDTLENARKLINQARMVTLSGELLDKSGTISGGHDKAKLHFASKNETDISVMRQTSKNLSDQLQSLQEALKELTASANEDRERLSDARSQLAQRLSELEGQRKLLGDLELEIEAAKLKLRDNGNAIDSLDQQIADIDSNLKALGKEITKLEESLEGVKDRGSKSAIEKLILESEELRAGVEAIEREYKEIERLIDTLETEERLEANNRETIVAQQQELLKEVEEINALKPQHEAIIGQLRAAIADKESKVSQLSEELESLRQAKENIHEKVTAEEIQKTKTDQEIIHLSEQVTERKLAHFDSLRQLNLLQGEIDRLQAENPDYQPPSAGTVEQLKQQTERLGKRMQALEPVNMKALEDYKRTDERQLELNEYMTTLSAECAEINDRISGYDELKRRTFLETFAAINNNFQAIFAELSHGHGRLELEDAENPFNGGLVIRAQPRDKKMQRIEALSGGEKSLTALSFVFAFQRYAPAPFYAFDEVDMMLDGSNAERLARMVKRQSESAQFVVVSLRRPMIEHADHAIGVSLRADGFSRVVGIAEVNIQEESQALSA